jgi:hypothetical protein
VKILKLTLLVMATSFLVSCQKEDNLDIVQIDDFESIDVLNDNTILGKQLENPYSVENMRKALAELKSSNALKSSFIDDDFEIETTHLYVRFLPKNEEELNLLKQDTLLHFYDYPLDYEIVSPGICYHDPTLPDTVITWQYTVVAPDYNFPTITHEILSELFLIEEKDEDSNLKSATVNIPFWDMLEDKALEITGNLDETNISGGVLKASKWRPAGRITANGRAIVGCKVKARRWFTTHRGYTNTEGRFSCDGQFRRDANYSVKWERNYWSIRSGTWGQAYYNGPKQRGDWNLDITGGASLRYAFIHQAAYDYFYRNPFNTQIPFEKKWFRSELKIGYYDKLGEDKAADFAKWRNWFTFPHIRIYKGQNSDASTTAIYATTIHELAHCAHWQKIVNAKGSNRISDFINAETKLKESWARGVQREFTTRFISSTYRPSYHGDYTAIVHSLLPLGYSLRQLEDALISASTMDEWKNNIKSKYENSNKSQLDNIFDRF